MKNSNLPADGLRGLKGFTLIEMIVVVVIVSILAAVAIPMVETSVKRHKEIELRRALRTIRTAIDEYRKFIEDNKIKVDDEDTYNYPPSLEDLVEGIEYQDKKNNERIQKFLRRIPKDPMTNSFEWGLRSYQDKPDDYDWGGENVYDVYTTSERTGLDGIPYKEW
ncbi:MAG: prepilin-type N-terminal cleavage/methylation domain-containing protein [Candidatus Aminicenantes bacterium]|nr:MAG: prepilin-type N-terminal cleavage/methylation domain-containing protein [Candidatus Aminicenantes bacterium]